MGTFPLELFCLWGPALAPCPSLSLANLFPLLLQLWVSGGPTGHRGISKTWQRELKSREERKKL